MYHDIILHASLDLGRATYYTKPMIDFEKIQQAIALLIDASHDPIPQIILHVSQEELDAADVDDRVTFRDTIEVGEEHVRDTLNICGVTLRGPAREIPCDTCDGSGFVEMTKSGDPQTAYETNCPDCNPHDERDYRDDE